MPPQQIEIAEAIAGIKRALRREREAPSDQPIGAASNRGRKLQRGAKYVHQGSLACADGPRAYREKIEHAGYTRYILDRNSRRYNEYGEELDDSETDDEADADAANQNPYSGIRLEELLCPLKYPAELATHPSLSHPYLSSALPDMIQSTHSQLRQERANLWRAKYLNRQLMGDPAWMPAGVVESADDWDLFEPKAPVAQKLGTGKRKREEEDGEGEGLEGREGPDQQLRNGKREKLLDLRPQANGHHEGHVAADDDSHTLKDSHATIKAVSNSETTSQPAPLADEATGARVSPKDTKDPKDPSPQDQRVLNGEATPHEHLSREKPLQGEAKTDTISDGEIDAAPHQASANNTRPPSPSPDRPITRALTANHQLPNHNNNGPHSPGRCSSVSSSDSHLQIDPLYLVPPSCHMANSILNTTTTTTAVIPHHRSSLPSSQEQEDDEVGETRRLLGLYVQKQEEVVRGQEAILTKLLTADRMRTEVLQNCKADEHVGELSDGEDWIDLDRWGLQPGELRKGRDEDEDNHHHHHHNHAHHAHHTVADEGGTAVVATAMTATTTTTTATMIGGRKGRRRARN